MIKKEKYYHVDSSIIGKIETVDNSEVKDCIVELHDFNDSKMLSDLKQFFRIIVAYHGDIEPIEHPDYTIVPTLSEAEDYLFMQQLEADLSDM